PSVVPLLYNLAIIIDVILAFSFGLQILRVNAFHSNEDLSAPSFARQADEIFWLAGQIHLHHERDLDAFLAKFYDRFERLTPEFFPGKIVVGEKVERHA